MSPQHAPLVSIAGHRFRDACERSMVEAATGGQIDLAILRGAEHRTVRVALGGAGGKVQQGGDS